MRSREPGSSPRRLVTRGRPLGSVRVTEGALSRHRRGGWAMPWGDGAALGGGTSSAAEDELLAREYVVRSLDEE